MRILFKNNKKLHFALRYIDKYQYKRFSNNFIYHTPLLWKPLIDITHTNDTSWNFHSI